MNITINDEVRAELDALYRKHGRLTEDVVIKASKRKGSALHAMFLWDDEAAAAAIGRKHLAQQLIMRVKITTQEAQNLNVRVGIRKYHGRLGGGYYDVQEVVTQETLKQQLLANARVDLMAARKKYKDLEELGTVFYAIDEVFPEEAEV